MKENSLRITPDNPHAQSVCSLFERYLCGRPPSFRDQISFLRKGEFELDWSAADGAVAVASFFNYGQPVSMTVLVSGLDPVVDTLMLETFRENVLHPLFGDQFDAALACEARPMLLEVIFPGQGEWLPALQLLSASLASVYFRGVITPSSPD
ncbi:MAG TPA: hypothetical protein VES20_17355 [Bryobacteraceae bacterium]|nr:hypothetical protein [Bryobacteraceae bacterium]